MDVADELGPGAHVHVVPQHRGPGVAVGGADDHHGVEPAVAARTGGGVHHQGAVVGDGQARAEDVQRQGEAQLHAAAQVAEAVPQRHRLAQRAATAVDVVLRLPHQNLEAPHVVAEGIGAALFAAAQGDLILAEIVPQILFILNHILASLTAAACRRRP